MDRTMMSDHETDDNEENETKDSNFQMNAKGYIQFNKNLIIAERYQLLNEIVLDEELGTTAKGRYGNVFAVQDLDYKNETVLKALKINRIPPEDEDAKRQAVKMRLKMQQKKRLNKKLAKTKQMQLSKTQVSHSRREKTAKERYQSSCKREIGVLKRITRKNQDEKYPVLVLYDHGEYLGHTYMIFPLYDQTLQQHLLFCQKERQSVFDTFNKPSSPGGAITHLNPATMVNCMIAPEDLWAIEEQLLSAIAYVHLVCSVMHLDFKPKNIMIDKYGYDCIQCGYNKNLYFLKLKCNKITLIDFSVSAKAPKKTDLDEIRFTGNFGTRRYRPPEMIYGGKWNRSVDTYGVAMIVLECIRLAPIIDTTHYKKKKILKYKHKYQHIADRNLRNKKLQAKKQLEIWEVLYLIIQQIGFPSNRHWNKNLKLDTKLLFPSKKQWMRLNDKSRSELHNIEKRSKNSNANSNSKSHSKIKKSHTKNTTETPSDSDSDSSSSSSSSQSDEDDDYSYITDMREFRQRFKKYLWQGKVWQLFALYGQQCIKKARLDVMSESLQRMLEWDPSKRIRPEDALQEYFNKVPEYLLNDSDDDDEDDFTIRRRVIDELKSNIAPKQRQLENNNNNDCDVDLDQDQNQNETNKNGNGNVNNQI